MRILDKGEIRLLNSMSGDLGVVAAARVSYGIEAAEGDDIYLAASKGPVADQKLLSYLAKHNHTSPFEQTALQFYVKAPIFVTREWMRHRTWSYNEISGRYVKFKPEFYIPTEWRVPAETNKQGSVVDEEKSPAWHSANTIVLESSQWAAFGAYEHLLNIGVAREMARIVLPVNIYTEFIATVDFWNLMHFLKLRCGSDAQWEIRQYANAIRDMVSEKFAMSIIAWKGAGLDINE